MERCLDTIIMFDESCDGRLKRGQCCAYDDEPSSLTECPLLVDANASTRRDEAVELNCTLFSRASKLLESCVLGRTPLCCEWIKTVESPKVSIVEGLAVMLGRLMLCDPPPASCSTVAVERRRLRLGSSSSFALVPRVRAPWTLSGPRRFGRES